MTSFARQVFQIDLEEVAQQFDQHGYALTKPLLNEKDCRNLIRMYDDKAKFRSRVVMERHNFGRGEYQYFADRFQNLCRGCVKAFMHRSQSWLINGLSD